MTYGIKLRNICKYNGGINIHLFLGQSGANMITGELKSQVDKVWEAF